MGLKKGRRKTTAPSFLKSGEWRREEESEEGKAAEGVKECRIIGDVVALLIASYIHAFMAVCDHGSAAVTDDENEKRPPVSPKNPADP